MSVVKVEIAGPTTIKGRNQTFQLTAILHRSDGQMDRRTDSVVWSSSNVSVAGVSQGGVVTTVGFGSVDMTASHENVTGRLSIQVEPINFDFQAISQGCCDGPDVNYSTLAAFVRDGVTLYSRRGGAGGGRGLNLMVIDLKTGQVREQATNFDTWSTQRAGSAMRAFIDALERQPNGVLLLIAVADEAGLNAGQSCSSNGYEWTERAYRVLEGLGARKIRSYCWRQSYSLIAVKGEGMKDEQLGARGIVVTSRYLLRVP